MAYKFGNGIDLQGQRAQGFGDPSAGTDGVNRQWVESFLRGMIIKDAVDAASTGNVTLATPGASIDGVALSNPARVLLKNQTDPTQNGIYDWTGAAAALVRSNDADGSGVQGSELRGGTIVYVTDGTANDEKAFAISAPNGDAVIGTDAITWTQFGGGGTTYTASNGVQLVGVDFSVKLDTASGLVAGAGGLKIDFTVVAKKIAANVGNGSSTAIDVTHNFGTDDVGVEVYATAGAKETVQPDVSRPDNNTVRLTWAVAPASNAYRAVVFG